METARLVKRLSLLLLNSKYLISYGMLVSSPKEKV